MKITAAKLEELLGQVFDGVREGLREEVDPEVHEALRRDFVFHMADWRDDLDGLADLFADPDRYDEEAASRLVIGFLYHAIPHLKAAGRLLLDQIDDPFSPSEDEADSRE